MKESIENIIKESLKEHELPYDASAWTSMSARLDKSMPTQTSSNALKWLIGGAAVVAAIAISAVYLFTDNKKELKSEKEVTHTAEKKQDPKTEENDVKSSTLPCLLTF